MVNDEDCNYELNARYDYIREAYGDPCPACGTLRWQADCPKCWTDPYDDPTVRERYFQDTFGDEWQAKLAEADAHVAEMEAAAARDREAREAAAARLADDDDIPF